MKKTRMFIFDQLSKQRNNQGAGFTLIELMIVIAILGILAAIALPAYSHQIEKARITKAIAEIRMLEKAIITYLLNPSIVPSQPKGKGKGKGQGQGQVASPDDLPNSLDDIGYGNLQDPWGNPYQFANHTNISPGERRKYRGSVTLNTDYDLYSMGTDGRTVAAITSGNGYDDVIRAGDGEYVGPASQY